MLRAFSSEPDTRVLDSSHRTRPHVAESHSSLHDSKSQQEQEARFSESSRWCRIPHEFRRGRGDHIGVSPRIGARAVSDQMELENRSIFLFCRNFATRSGIRFAGNCSRAKRDGTYQTGPRLDSSSPEHFPAKRATVRAATLLACAVAKIRDLRALLLYRGRAAFRSRGSGK